jgi:hypothetical protein
MPFPAAFVWGAAASYQIEGAATEEGAAKASGQQGDAVGPRFGAARSEPAGSDSFADDGMIIHPRGWYSSGGQFQAAEGAVGHKQFIHVADETLLAHVVAAKPTAEPDGVVRRPRIAAVKTSLPGVEGLPSPSSRPLRIACIRRGWPDLRAE